LWLKVLIGMGSGLLVGYVLGPSARLVAPDVGALLGSWLALPGMLFIAAVQMIVIPLVFASIILGLAAGEDIDQLRRLGIVVVLFFVVTTALAAAIGLGVATILEPGIGLADELRDAAVTSEPAVNLQTPSLAEIPETLVRLLPANPLSSMVEGEMLQVVIFAIVFGVALVALTPAQSKPILDLLASLQQVCMTVVRWAMRLAPVAVFGLMARLTSQIGVEALVGMAFYVATVLIGLALMLLVYMALLWLGTKRSPRSFMAATRNLLLLAFSTSSSAAVMPLSIKTAQDEFDVRPSIAHFVIPLGATINMNGTALYQGVATVFLAQVYGVDITLSGLALVVAIAVGASIGSPATPGVGIVILSVVLASVGVPVEGIALLMGVDRILDMSRTAINVAGDVTASALMDQWVGGDAGEE
jgi:Na+/H+-dicarboxylate symporter